MISGRIGKLVNKVAGWFQKPKVQTFAVDIPWTNPAPVKKAVRKSSRRRFNAVEKRRRNRMRGRARWRRADSRKLAAMCHMLPPPEGHRRAEFSSPIPGKWSRAEARS